MPTGASGAQSRRFQLALRARGARPFFRPDVNRHRRASLTVTSNKGFGDRCDLFNDHVLGTVILDRLLRYSTTLGIKDESYRLKEKRRTGLLGGVKATLATNGRCPSIADKRAQRTLRAMMRRRLDRVIGGYQHLLLTIAFKRTQRGNTDWV